MTDFILDFDDLGTGTVVGEQFLAKGVTISSGSPGNPPMIFDTRKPTGQDADLATAGMGKVLILSEDGDSSDPDDNAGGGTLRFDFAEPAEVHSLKVLDFECGGQIRLFDGDGALIKTVAIDPTSDNGQGAVEIDCAGVQAMEVWFPESGAIDDISYSMNLDGAAPVLDGIVEGTENDDLIDLAYTGDPEGDRIDNDDAILPGEAPDDDIVYAGAGDDTVYGGEGDDEIWGDRAQDGNIGGPVTITLDGGEAFYHNKLFAYTIDPATGEIGDLVILTENAPQDGIATYTYNVAPGAIVGIGIYSPDGTFLSSGYGDNVDLNTDGLEHTRLVMVNPDGSVQIAFEDLYKLGDRDFNDVIVTVDLGTSGAIFDNAHVDYASNAPGPDDSGVGNDMLYGEAGDDTIYGQGGNDLLDGGEGDDTLDGGIGDDEIIGGDGSDTAYGGDGDDVIDTSATGYPLPDRGFPGYGPIPAIPADPDPTDDIDTVYGGAGNDTISTGDDADFIDGGEGDDFIDGGIDDDEILGGDGADTIIGGEGSDVIDGGAGDDTIYGGLGPDPALDPLNIRDDGSDAYGPDPVQDNGRDVIHGGDGNDTIYGQDDDDVIYGDAGDDVIDGGIDEDVLFGGAGADMIYGGEGDDIVSGGEDADTISGDDGNDLLFGGAGDDSIMGGDGDDIIVGGDGADDMDGGSGDDLFVEVRAGDHVDGGDGKDTLVLSGPAIISYNDDTKTSGTINFLDFGNPDPVGQATFENVETLTYVIPDPDPVPPEATFTSAPGDGSDGSTPPPPPPPTVDGIVHGTSGNDQMDMTYVDAEGDRIDDGYSLPGLGGNDDVVIAYDGNDVVLTGLGDDFVFAGAGNDFVRGGPGNDWIRGEAGDDDLRGEEGDDRLRGDEGNDVLSGGEGNDKLVGGEGDDKLDGGAGNDLLVGGDAEAPDHPTAQKGDDILHGGEGSDILFGDGGDDRLELGEDNDVDLAFGGADRDTFAQVRAGDHVAGGESGDDFDTLDLSDYDGPLRVDWTNGDPATESGTVTYFDKATGAEVGKAHFVEIESVVPCFTPGTRVATPGGEKAVEDLRVGDRVLTRDNGVQQIRWYGRKRLACGELGLVPHLQPVLIPRGALGDGLPERDMLVSPNHRMLVSNDMTSLYFAEHEVLVAAKHLADMNGIRRVAVPSTTYIHFMFDQHEVVLADGAWSESFQPGDYTLGGIDSAQRNEILEIFPELSTVEGRDGYIAARRTLKRHEAVLLQQ